MNFLPLDARNISKDTLLDQKSDCNTPVYVASVFSSKAWEGRSLFQASHFALRIAGDPKDIFSEYCNIKSGATMTMREDTPGQRSPVSTSMSQYFFGWVNGDQKFGSISHSMAFGPRGV